MGYPLGRSLLISFRSARAISCLCRKDRFRFVVFFVKIWLPNDFEKVNFPEAVFLNRFAAARLVFIFGMVSLLYPEKLNGRGDSGFFEPTHSTRVAPAFKNRLSLPPEEILLACVITH
jgi:hypothetical protein